MAAIGFLLHLHRQEATEVFESTAAWLKSEGHEAYLLADSTDGGTDGNGELIKRLDLAVSLGGDGTMLRTVDLVAGSGVPVLGVNLGRLGYLTEVGPEELCDALRRFLAGDYRLEERMTLSVEVLPRTTAGPAVAGPAVAEPADVEHHAPHARRHVANALNDAVLQRLPEGHTVRLAMSVDGAPFLTYAADSIIVATPTGSTAYNLSARGPIASPRARVIIVTPVAAHMLFDRSLLLAPDEEVTLEVIDGGEGELVVDGQSHGCLASGDTVRCRAGQHDARLVSFGTRDFRTILKQKFGLTDR